MKSVIFICASASIKKKSFDLIYKTTNNKTKQTTYNKTKQIISKTNKQHTINYFQN